MKGFMWAVAPALTSLGYLLILLVSIFPFWVRLVNEESHEVFFSGLFENCFHIKCWKPRPLSGKEGWRQDTAEGDGAGVGPWVTEDWMESERTEFNNSLRAFSESLLLGLEESRWPGKD